MKPKKPSPVWWIAGAGFLLAALACWIGFEWSASRISADGETWDTFRLIPLTFFLAVCGVISLAVGLAGWMAARRPKDK